mmetsp:Transcript_18449/g.37118  ORF Transcript_18449/g.37118 Transcript_18449/m.37118 type:complete len:203 (+) Transcript_18449:366-974(+)|eukprot:CAMPEP_0178706674 /NCGR_PEP_ID=MMETSP0699-20121125/15550_1 /TAXON_ID=265572 /ORGANISM="Extubocellulus spinifer, Strain CCMP396" /LENGTH=202 /DNA_ID=CAMNT_0020354525 /DNA_START=314 /DNA_END=922 /DNA_ORIENTATION=-
MANASAKKASAARSAAASTYRPLVVGINIVHFLIRLYQYSVSGNTTLLSTTSLAIHVLLLVLTGIAYRGILDDYAASATSTSKITGSGSSSSNSSCSNSNSSKNKLAGGASLDLLGLIVVIQYGSALFSDTFYWLLGILPLWGAFRLYKTVTGAKDGLMGGGGGVQNSGGRGSAGDGAGGGDSDAAEERRRKRAERRRMKRG